MIISFILVTSIFFLNLREIFKEKLDTSYSKRLILLVMLFPAKHKEWQELVPKLISGDIKKLTAVIDAHHRREKTMASLRSR